MKKKTVLLLVALCACLCFAGCDNSGDYISVHNRTTWVYDDIGIEIKEGYFYSKHEKFTVDDDTVAVMVYFTKTEDAGWDNKLNEDEQ